MPRSDFIHHVPHKRPWYRVEGDQWEGHVPGVSVYNTGSKATGSAAAIGTVSTLVLPANPARKAVTITHTCSTGTVHFWLGLGHAAAVDRGLGPLVAFGSTFLLNGTTFLWMGPIYAIHDGTGPANLAWEEVE